MEEFDIKKSELKNAEMINNIYNNPVASAFFGLVKPFLPFIGDFTDEVIKNKLSDFQGIKRKEFCEIVFSNYELVTIEMVSDVEFIMEFMKTLDVVNRLSSNNKVKYLANLFKNSYITTKERNLDEYEEWLNRLSDLSYREIILLEYLYECDKKMNNLQIESNEPFSIKQKSWELFLQNEKKLFGLNDIDLSAIISGTSRTGFCQMVGALNQPIDSSTNTYYITDYFRRFAEKIK